MKNKSRDSNMELLRIVSILLIISFHYVYKGGYIFSNHLTINKLIVKTFWLFGELGVNLFMLTTGYFLINGEFKIKKLIKLVLQVSFYYILTTIFACCIGYINITDIKSAFLTLFPVTLNKYWFITAYIIIYIFSPYINKFAKSLDKISYKKLLLILLAIYCLIPTFFGLFFNSTEEMLYYNRLIWLTIIYLVGAYIKLHQIPKLSSSKNSITLSIASFGIMIFSILFIEKFDKVFSAIGTTEVAYVWTPNNILMFLLSLGIFHYFLYLKIKENKIINKISSTTLGIYLLHDGVLAYWFWNNVFNNSTHQKSPLLIMYILGTTFIIFVIGVGIDLIRQTIEKYTLDKLLKSKSFDKTLNDISNLSNKLLSIGEEQNLTNKKNNKNVKNNVNIIDNILDKLYDNKIIRYFLITLLSLSFSLLSFFQLVKYDDIFGIITIIVSAIASFIFITKTVEENYEYFKKNKITSLIILLLSMIVIIAMHRSKGILFKNEKFLFTPVRIFRLRGWILALPALFYFFIWCYRKIKKVVIEFWKELSPQDKKIYKTITFISFIVISILYVLNSKWYTQYDIVYSIDSGFVFREIFGKLTYYDVRHPILGVLLFPLRSIVKGLSLLIVPSQLLNTVIAIILQMINIQLLLASAFIIKQLSRNKWSLYIYLCSAPTILFAFFLEKYQICTFLVLYYVYQYCKEEKERATTLVLATGAMPTSIIIYLKELFTKESIKDKLFNIFKLAIIGLTIVICLGRTHLLVPNNMIEEITIKTDRFTTTDITIKNSLISYTNMVHGTYLPLSSVVNTKYNWTGIMEKISYIGILVFIIMIIGFIINRKDKFTQMCTLWTIVSFLLIVVVNWSVHESPLFSIYFSWAFIPLFQKGLDYIIKKFKLNEKHVYYPIIITMLVLNTLNMINIFQFFM